MDFSKDVKIKNISENTLAELSAFYADENFLIDVTNIKKETFTLNNNYSKLFLSNKCNELETDYLFISEIEISDSTVINSRVYNCKGRFVSQHESIIKDRFFYSFEKHILKTLKFLPEKKNYQIHNENEIEEIIVLIDTSPAFTTERVSLQSLIQETANSSDNVIGLIFPSRRKPRFIPPLQGNKEILEALIKVPKEKIFLEDVKDAILHSLEGLGKNKYKRRKFLIATAAKPSATEFDFSDIISTLSRLNYEVYIVTGSYFDNKTNEIYRKAGRKSGKGLQSITHYQKLGTREGLKTIFINDQKIFLADGFETTERDFDSIDKIQIPSSQIYSKAPFPHYGNMADIYEAIHQKKVLEKGKIHNNIKSVVYNILENKKSDYLSGYKKILIKSGNASIWIKVPSANNDLIDKEVTIKTTFVKDRTNSFGFSNIANQTTISPKITSSMLTYSPKELSDYFRQDSGKLLKCFLKGKVYEVK